MPILMGLSHALGLLNGFCQKVHMFGGLELRTSKDLGEAYLAIHMYSPKSWLDDGEKCPRQIITHTHSQLRGNVSKKNGLCRI